MVTKNGRQNRLKIQKLSFNANLKFEAFGDHFFLKLDISSSKYQKNLLIYCVPWLFSSSVKIFFWYLLVLYINSSVKSLQFAPKWSFSYFQPILAAIFVTIATVKVELIPDLYTLAFVLINL